MEKFEAQRQELANAEKLFDLPITVYPVLVQLQKELKGQEQIYAIYEEQKVAHTDVCYEMIYMNQVLILRLFLKIYCRLAILKITLRHKLICLGIILCCKIFHRNCHKYLPKDLESSTLIGIATTVVWVLFIFVLCCNIIFAARLHSLLYKALY